MIIFVTRDDDDDNDKEYVLNKQLNGWLFNEKFYEKNITIAHSLSCLERVMLCRMCMTRCITHKATKKIVLNTVFNV